MTHVEGSIVRCELEGVDAFYFVPAQFNNRNVCSPVVFVFDDAGHTAESAMELIVSKGIAGFAQDQEATVVVFNPLGQNGWSEADVKAYGAVFGNYTDNSDVQLEMGLSIAQQSHFGPSPAGRYPGAATGSTVMVYIVANGKGAQFVTQFLANDKNAIPGPWHNTIPLTPTGFVLFGANDVTVEASGQPIPAALYNCTSETTTYFDRINQKPEYTYVGNGSFDAKSVSEGLAFVHQSYRYGTGATLLQLIKIPDYKALGIHDEVQARTISTGVIEYSMYTPQTADMTKSASVPVLLLFHGGGNSAEFIAWSTAYPEVGKEDRLVVISVNHHVARGASEIMELVDILFKENPAFDSTRLYASGFSMGSVKTQELMAKFGDRFAAVAPHSGSGGFGEALTKVPFFYIAGEESPLPELPHQNGSENQIDTFMKDICAMNDIPYTGFNPDAGNRYGMRADKVETATSIDGLHVMTKVIFCDSDGQPFTVLASTSNMTHSTLRFNAEQSWQFMRQFTRKLDGSILVSGQA